MGGWGTTTWLVGGSLAAITLYLLHRLALWFEREGWIRYWHTPPRSDGGGAILGELQKIYEPQTRHVYEMKEQVRPRKEAESGDDPPNG